MNFARIRKELRDQSAHGLTGTIGALPVLAWPGILACAWLFFVMGMVREVAEEGTPVTLRKIGHAARSSWWDLSWWTAFGAAVGLAWTWCATGSPAL